MSSAGGRFKLTIKRTNSQADPAQRSNGASSVGTAEQRVRAAPGQQNSPANQPSAAAARPSPSGSVPRPGGGLTLKGAARNAAPRPSTGTPAAPRIMLKGASSNNLAATPSSAAPKQAAVPATPASAPGTGPRRLALKGSSSRPLPPAAAAAGTPATPAAHAAAGAAAATPRTAPAAVGNSGAGGGFATPRPAAVAGATPAPTRAHSLTSAAGGGGGGSAQPGKKLGIRLKGSSSMTPASSGGMARMPSATPGSMMKHAATPGSTASGSAKPRITLNKSRGRSMSMHSQPSMQSLGSQQLAAPYGSGQQHMQPAAYKQEHAAGAANPEQQPSQYGDYAYGGGQQGLHGYDSSQAPSYGYGSLPDGGYMSHDYSSAAAGMDPAAAAAGGGMYGSYTGPGVVTHDGAAAAAGGAGYGAGHDGMYGMGMDPAAAAATAVVDYSSQAYHYPGQHAGQKRSRSTPSARAAPAASPLGPRAKRPKPGQFRDDAEEDPDEDFNPKAERARVVSRGAGGSGGAVTARAVKSKAGGARVQPAWQARAAGGAGRTGARAAAAHKAAHKAAQAAAQRMHPHAAPRAAGAGHVAAVVPTHRARHHMMPVGQSAAAAAAVAPRSPVLGEGDLMTGADAAAAFARSAAAQDAVAVLDMDLEGGGGGAGAAGGGAAAAAAAAPAAARPAPAAAAPRAAGGARGGARGGAQQPRRTVEQVLQELHTQVEYVEETHPPTRESLNMLLAAVDKRDKYRFFVKPVTDEQAPGYSSIIRNPMDLSKMKGKVESGMYATWNELMSDIILMCANAKVYNHPNTKPHKEADVIFKYSVKYVKSFKQGKTSLRGAVAVAVRNANNEAAAAASGGAAAGAGGGDAGKAAGGAGAIQGPVTRATRRGRRPREEEAAPVTKKRKGDKFIALAERNSAADWSLTSSLDGDSARDTYKARMVREMYAAQWGGLADGASPEGVGFGGFGKPILRCVAGHAANLPPSTYISSLSRFVAGAGPTVERLVMKVLGNDLATKLIPIPGVTPTQLPQHPGVAHAHAQQHRQLPQQQMHQQQQQQHMAQQHMAQQQMHRAQGAMQPVAQGLPQQQQQQALAGLFGGAQGIAGVGQGQNVLSGLTPAQLAQLQRAQPQAGQQAGQQQQFVPGPQQLMHAMGMARPQVPMQARQP